jgi:hypothetical protein
MSEKLNIKALLLGLIKRTEFWIILVILLAVIIFISTCNPTKPASSSDGTIATIKPVKKYIDKQGVEHAVIPTNVVSVAIMEYRLDSLRRALKASQLNQVTTVTARVDTVFKDRIITRNDETGDFEVEYKDSYVTAKTKGNNKTNKANIELSMTDTITYVDYTKKHLFKANERIIDISNKNPYNKITHGSSITLKEPKAIVTFGPYVGYGVSFPNGKPQLAPSIGIAATVNLFSIKTRK